MYSFIVARKHMFFMYFLACGDGTRPVTGLDVTRVEVPEYGIRNMRSVIENTIDPRLFRLPDIAVWELGVYRYKVVQKLTLLDFCVGHL
jgi:hypothetical protein